jgi:hypothetical protein
VPPPDQRIHYVFIKRHRHHHAAQRDAVVVGGGCRQALFAPLAFVGGAHAVDGEGRCVVHPHHTFTLQVAPGLCHKPACRCGAVLQAQARLYALGHAGHDGVAWGDAQQRGRCTLQPAVAVKNVQRGAALVHDGKGGAAMVARVDDPARQLAHHHVLRRSAATHQRQARKHGAHPLQGPHDSESPEVLWTMLGTAAVFGND